MHIERIHFEEVFDVQSSRGDFSFRSRGRPHYGVNLQNRVIPDSGSTFVVAFERPGDWERVLGSRDLASGKVVLARPTWLDLLFHADFYLFGLPFLVGTLVMGGFWAGLVLAALLLLPMGWLLVQGVRANRAVRRALLDIGQNDTHPDNGSSALRSSVQ